MTAQPENVQFTLPAWLADYAAGATANRDRDARMDFVIGAARRNVVQKSGGPFAAGVFEVDSGKLIALGVNLVTSQQCALLHGEMVALMLASKILGTHDLGGQGMAAHELVTSAEPCAMCLGAIPWSGLRRVVTGARDRDVRAIGFDEGFKVGDWRHGLEARGIEVVTDVRRAGSVAVLQEYAAGGGEIYNGRRT